jgi:ligand-binding SRPBCC domain-containing protein
MKTIRIKTKVQTSYKKVFERFDLSLFEALKPPMVNLEVERFDGCLKGNEVHLNISIGFMKSKWISLITEDSETDQEIYFIDVGKELPFPLRYWKHKHRILNVNEQQAEIIDEIQFSSGKGWLDILIYPVLYAQFALRGPIYRDVLGKI